MTVWQRLRHQRPTRLVLAGVLLVVAALNFLTAATDSDDYRIVGGVAFIGFALLSALQPASGVSADEFLVPDRWFFWRSRAIPPDQVVRVIIPPPEGPAVTPTLELRDGELVDIPVDNARLARLAQAHGIPVRRSRQP